MKRYSLIIIFMLLAGSGAFAQDASQKSRTIKADLNQDGFIDKQEFKAMRTVAAEKLSIRSEKVFDRMDKNSDDVLDKDELLRARMHKKAMQGKRKTMARAKPNRTKKGRNRMAKKRKMINRRFNAMDRNNNGFVSFREFKRQAKTRPNYTRRIARRTFNRIDRNGDGLISKREMMSTPMKKRRPNRRR